MEKDLGYRRVQQTGRGSYIISLPKNWVQDTGLTKGNQIAFKIQDDSSLILVPRKIIEGRKGTEPELRGHWLLIEPRADPQSVCRKIISLYVISADLIHIRFKGGASSKHKLAIKNLVRHTLLGSEIIHETQDEITLQILINQLQFPVEKAIRRMSVLALSANANAISALKTMDHDLIQSVVDLHNDVNRLSLYVIRQLKFALEQDLFRELGFKTPKEFLGYRIVTNDIKNISTNAMNIAKNITTLNDLIKTQVLSLKEYVDEEVYSQILKVNASAHQFFEASLNALFKRNYEQADNLITNLKRFTTLEHDLIILISSKKMDPNISSTLRLILDNSRRIGEYSQNLAEITLNRTIEEVSSVRTFNHS